MNYMEAYVSQWLPFPPRKLFYPAKRSRIKTRIMEDAYLEGFSVKEICEYFNIKPHDAYGVLNVRALKVKRAEKLLLENEIN